MYSYGPEVRTITYPDGSHAVAGKRLGKRIHVDRLQQVTDVFRNISSYIIDGLMDTYGLDFQIFGYTWDKDKGAGMTKLTMKNAFDMRRHHELGILLKIVKIYQ